MELECAGELGVVEATEDSIKHAFADDRARGEFVILSRSGQEYLQAFGEGNDPFQLEYRDGEEIRHFRAKEDVSKENVQKCFLLYLKGDPAWRTQQQWEPAVINSSKSPWWKFW
jgi:hypothetical protein